MNYCVIGNGHITFFDVFEDALEFWDELDHIRWIFNMWGMRVA